MHPKTSEDDSYIDLRKRVPVDGRLTSTDDQVWPPTSRDRRAQAFADGGEPTKIILRRVIFHK